MKMLLLRIIWLLWLSAAAVPLLAQPVEINGATHMLYLAGHLSVSPKESTVSSAQQALALYRSGGFEKLPGNLGRGYKTNEVWLAFDLLVTPGAPELLVAEVGPAFLDRVTAYQADAAGQISLLGHAGDQVPRTQVALLAYKPSFAVRLQRTTHTTVLLQIKTTSTQAAIVKLYKASEFPAALAAEGLLLGFIFTLSLVMLLLAIGLCLVFRDLVYLYWLGQLVATVGLWFMVDGLAYRYLDWSDPRDIKILTTTFSILSFAASTIFVNSMFEFKSLHRRLHEFFVGWTVFSLTACLLASLAGYSQVRAVLMLANLPILALMFIAVVMQMARRHHESLWYGPLFILFLFAAIYNLLTTLGLLPYTEIGFYGWQVTGLLNLLSMQVALFARVRQTQQRHVNERTKLLAQLTRQNLELEVQVNMRTQSLSQTLRAVQQAEVQQRQLLSMASHEFRTPAAMIKASLDSLVFLKDSIAPEVATRLTHMRQASVRLVELSNNLIDQDRLLEMALKPRLLPVDLGRLVVDVLARYPAPVMSELPQGPVTIEGDAALLSIALHNLVDNALRHGGSIDGDTRPVIVALHLQPDWVELQVADFGPGIADEDKQKVFERFHVIPRRHRRVSDCEAPPPASSGLGLAIVQSIAHAHGGEALVRDNSPQGAVLVLRLPLKA
jgi:signal transduction histidine kinase